jgi:hypothetical protein
VAQQTIGRCAFDQQRSPAFGVPPYASERLRNAVADDLKVCHRTRRSLVGRRRRAWRRGDQAAERGDQGEHRAATRLRAIAGPDLGA